MESPQTADFVIDVWGNIIELNNIELILLKKYQYVQTIVDLMIELKMRFSTWKSTGNP